MANNPPLYPGYAPQKPGEIQNPLYPGYYPGKPFARRPGKSKNFIKPIPEFGITNVYEDYLDGFGENIEKVTTRVPQWISERMADDFKQAFKAAIKPESISLDTLDDLNADALPGAFGISVDLDPREWIKDPKKMAKKTATGWWKAAVNFDDIADREKRLIWAKLTLDDGGIGKGPEELTYPGESIIRDLAISTARGEIKSAQKGIATPRAIPKNPFALTNRGVLGDDTPPEYYRVGYRAGPRSSEVLKEDVFYKVRNEFLGFVENVDAFHTRDKKMESFSRACNKAASTELYQKQFDMFGIDLNQELGAIANTFAGSQQSYLNLDSVLQDLTKVAKDSKQFIGMDRLWKAATTPEEKASVVTNVLLNFDKILEVKNQAQVVSRSETDTIKSAFAPLLNKVEATAGREGITDFLLRNKVEQSLGSIGFFSGKMKSAIGGSFLENPNFVGNRAHFDLLAVEIGKTKQYVEAYTKYLDQTGKVAERALFEKKYGNRISEHLNALEKTVGQFGGALNEYGDIAKRLSNTGVVNKDVMDSSVLLALMTGVSRGDLTSAAGRGDATFKTFIDNHLNSLGESGIRREVSGFLNSLEKSLGEKQIRGGLLEGDFPDAIQSILHNMTKETSLVLTHGSLKDVLEEKGLNSANLAVFLERARLDVQVSKVDQIVTYLNHPEKIAEGLLWKKISKKVFPTYSYSIYSFKDFIRVGLTQAHHLGLIINDGVLYKEKGLFKINPDVRNAAKRPNGLFGHYFKVEFDPKLNIPFSGTFFGGGHFDFIGTGPNGEEGVLGKILNKGSLKEGWKDPLLGDVLAGKLWVWDKNKGLNQAFVARFGEFLPGFDASKAKNFQKDLQRLRRYLLANGCTLDQINDPEFMLAMANSLNKINRDGRNITRRYLGVLEKIYFRANALQAAVFKGPLTRLWKYAFGLKSYIKTIWREVIRKFADEIIKKLSAHAIGQALGSLLPGLGNLIAAIVIWLGEKIVNFIFNIFNNLKKMFEKGDFEFLLDDAEASAAKWLKRIGFIVFILLLISNVIGGIASFSLNLFGSTLNDPFSEAIPFSLSTFASSDDTRQYSSMLQSFDWNIYLDEYGKGSGGIGLPSGGTLGPVIDCSAPMKLPTKVATGSSVADLAYDLVSELKRGFWCMFNNNSLFADLWNLAKYVFNSSPEHSISNPTLGTNDLFWCTWLVIKSYQSTDSTFPALTGVYSMLSYFKDGGVTIIRDGMDDIVYTNDKYAYTSVGTAKADNVKPGDVVFFSKDGGQNPAHVGVVYSVSEDGITTVESNSGVVSNFIPINEDGSISSNITDGDYITVMGFGTAK